MSRPFWELIEMEKVPGLIVVDCGYVNHQHARDRADALLAAGVGKTNLQVFGSMGGRILLRIPPGKWAALSAQFPLVAGKVYYGSTHHWDDGWPADGAAPKETPHG